MDSQQFVARSPPPYIKELLSSALAEYTRLANRVQQKKAALDKLSLQAPKAIYHNIDLKVSTLAKENRPNDVAQLASEFDAVVLNQRESMRQIIYRGAQLELALVEESLQKLIPDTKTKIMTFFTAIHNSTSPTISFEDLIACRPLTSPVAHDYHTSISYLDTKVSELRYNSALAMETKRIKAAEAAAKRAAAEEMEVETSNDILVATLVKNAIEKTTQSLRREINTLRAALKVSASRPGPTAGKKQKRKGSAKAREQPNAPKSKQEKKQTDSHNAKQTTDAKPKSKKKTKPRQKTSKH